MKSVLLNTLLFCVLFTTALTAQPVPKTFLWKISGNGLQKPSYLYGTMHLTDKRLFAFGDSLYAAIEKSDGFAMELNPDDFNQIISDAVENQISGNKKIKDILSREAYAKYGGALSKKFHKPEDEITTYDLKKAKNKWLKRQFQKSEMNTIMDLYLYDVARRQGKWIGGVEDKEDQSGLLDLYSEADLDILVQDKYDAQDRTGEKFVKLYESGDLREVSKVLIPLDSAYQNTMILKRNLKMAARMDSLGRLRSMVFAVGVAHLPGEGGLIALLTNKGFRVDPVISSKKIKPEKYKMQPIDLPWVDVRDQNDTYTAQMPGIPKILRANEGFVQMNMYFDLFTMTGYIAAGFNTLFDKDSIEHVMANYADKMFHIHDLKNAKTVIVNGVEGKDLSATDEDGYKHGYLFFHNHILYMAVGVSVHEKENVKKDIQRFLNSFQMLEKQPGAMDGYTYTDTLYAFKVKFPYKPSQSNELTKKVKDPSIRSVMVTSTDPATGNYFAAGVNEAAPGYIIGNDSTTLESIRVTLKGKLSSVVSDTMYVKNNHRVLDFSGKIAGSTLEMRTYYEFRGNRWYALVAVYDPAKKNPGINRFFSSFELIEYPQAHWSLQTDYEGKFTMWAPSVVTVKKGRNGKPEKYQAYDATQSTGYDISWEVMTPHYWRTDSAFWKGVVKTTTAQSKGSLKGLENIANGDVKGIELYFQRSGSSNLMRERLVLYGDTLYTLSAIAPETSVKDANTNRLFEGFRFSHPAPSTSIFTSKAARLLKDLESPDPEMKKFARDELITAPFNLEELPLLHQALLKSYSDDSAYHTINLRLLTQILTLKDPSSQRFAKKEYVSTNDQQLKCLLLEIIADDPTTENYRDLLNLITQSPPKEAPGYRFVSKLITHGRTTASLYPHILDLIKDTVMAAPILNLTSNLLHSDSNFISPNLLKPYLRIILQDASYQYGKTQKFNHYSTTFSSLLDILGYLKDSLANNELQKWSLLEDSWLTFKAVESLLQNDQPVRIEVLEKLGADKNFRVSFYEKLKKANRESLFPMKYRTQKDFAESLILREVDEEDEGVDSIRLTYLQEKTLVYEGRQARFLFFKSESTVDGNTNATLAYAGPFDIDPARVYTGEEKTGYYMEDDFDPEHPEASIDSQVKELTGHKKGN